MEDDAVKKPRGRGRPKKTETDVEAGVVVHSTLKQAEENLGGAKRRGRPKKQPDKKGDLDEVKGREQSKKLDADSSEAEDVPASSEGEDVPAKTVKGKPKKEEKPVDKIDEFKLNLSEEEDVPVKKARGRPKSNKPPKVPSGKPRGRPKKEIKGSDHGEE